MKVSVGVILADQLTLFQPGGTDYPHLITTGTPGFSDLPTAQGLQVQIHTYVRRGLSLQWDTGRHSL